VASVELYAAAHWHPHK